MDENKEWRRGVARCTPRDKMHRHAACPYTCIAMTAVCDGGAFDNDTIERRGSIAQHSVSPAHSVSLYVFFRQILSGFLK